MNPQKVVISENLEQALTEAVKICEHDRTFFLVDETTERCCLPLISGMECVQGAATIVIGATDANKTLESLAHVWEALGEGGATRHSLLINIGGGMVTDLGGFAASTFKRGINYINIPTTLLAMVDASVGGKTGINFRGLKNEVGVFSNASTVILDVAVKQRIVTEDPLEQGIRKALNLGHTIGHAFESFALSPLTSHLSPLLHGYAVAYGLVCELYLSAVKTGFPTDKMHQTVSFIKEHYGKMAITCDDYPTLLELMTHDKKNVAGTINFTLLGGIGDIRINQTATKEEIFEALDFYREC